MSGIGPSWVFNITKYKIGSSNSKSRDIFCEGFKFQVFWTEGMDTFVYLQIFPSLCWAGQAFASCWLYVEFPIFILCNCWLMNMISNWATIFCIHIFSTPPVSATCCSINMWAVPPSFLRRMAMAVPSDRFYVWASVNIALKNSVSSVSFWEEFPVYVLVSLFFVQLPMFPVEQILVELLHVQKFPGLNWFVLASSFLLAQTINFAWMLFQLASSSAQRVTFVYHQI